MSTDLPPSAADQPLWRFDFTANAIIGMLATLAIARAAFQLII